MNAERVLDASLGGSRHLGPANECESALDEIICGRCRHLCDLRLELAEEPVEVLAVGASDLDDDRNRGRAAAEVVVHG